MAHNRKTLSIIFFPYPVEEEKNKMNLQMPAVEDLTAFDRYILRNVIVHELAKWQPDMELFMTNHSSRIDGIPNKEMFFKCWIDLALRVTNVPHRSQASEHLIWEEQGSLHHVPYTSKLIFRNKRFHRIWYDDKNMNSHLPIIVPVGDTLSYYLAYYILHLRAPGPYLFHGATPWTRIASDVKTFIATHLKLERIIRPRLLHNMRHIIADTIGVVTNFNQSIMHDVSLVMRHTHQMQQERYATGTKWGQVSTSLYDHQSYHQHENVKLLYPSNRSTLQSWEDMGQAIRQGNFQWGTTVTTHVIPIETLSRCTLLFDSHPLFQHFPELPPKTDTTLHESLTACFPNHRIQFNPAIDLNVQQLKSLVLKRDR